MYSADMSLLKCSPDWEGLFKQGTVDPQGVFNLR